MTAAGAAAYGNRDIFFTNFPCVLYRIYIVALKYT